MLQKWKEKSGEFSKKSQTNTEKTYEKFEKSSDVFGKNSNVFQEISNVFSGTSEKLSQSEKSDFGRRGVKVVKAKSAKSQGRRARHTRVRKNLNEVGAKWNKSDLPFHPTKFGRKYASHGAKSTTFAKYTKQFHLRTKKKLHFFGDFYLFASFGTHIV